MDNRQRDVLIIASICAICLLGLGGLYYVCVWNSGDIKPVVVSSEAIVIKLYVGEMIQIQSTSYGNSFLIYRGLDDYGIPQFSCMIIPVSTERNVVVFDINYQSNMSFHILRAYTVVEEFFVKEYTSSFVVLNK